jgi:methylmalonyl-CoA mutase N-terminal domain/subunit
MGACARRIAPVSPLTNTFKYWRASSRARCLAQALPARTANPQQASSTARVAVESDGMATTEDPRAPSAEAEGRNQVEADAGRGVDEWKRELYDAKPEREGELLTTMSGLANAPLYTPDNVDVDYERDLGYPGVYPFTRGVYPSMYRGKLWTMRQFAGFGTAEETNERFRYLLEHGQTGLSTAFDMPTLMGYDSDHPRSLGEVGREGVAIDSLDDVETLFAGIPLDEVSTSMTVNSPAAMLLAFYLCVGEEQRVPRERLRGTIQTDILKEYIAQKEWIFPPEPSMRLVIDMIEFCASEMPLFHPISISGYHIREAGSTAAQELAFTLADGFAYVEAAMERGLDVDDFAPRLSFFFNAHLDFFEEIAKYRAARRIWAHEMKERYGARNPRSWLMRFHTQTAGVSLTAQQPEVNIIRTALEALAAVLGGTQSLHTNSFDEALALPTENAVRLALRTQQVIAHETGVVNSIDPLGGSYYVEDLTNRLEAEAYDYFDRIRRLGGVIPAIKENFFQREIAEASFRYQHEVEQKQRIVVGVNRYTHADEEPLEILRIDPGLEEKQIRRVQALRARRDTAAVEAALVRLKEDAARDGHNLMPPIVDAAKAHVTMGEMCDALRDVWGIWRETPVF